MNLKTLADVNIEGKIVVVRADYNVPLKDEKIIEDTRIVASLPTIKKLLEMGAKRIHLLTHLGRPKGIAEPSLSTIAIAKRLGQLLDMEVEHRSDFTPSEAKIQLHENTRFWPGEKKNNPAFVQELLNIGGEIFVMDAFGTAHRGHASVVGLARYMPAVAGLLVAQEVEAMSPYLTDEKQPGLTVMVGGAKLDTKIAVLEQFAKIADNILVGGALANTFLAAQGFDVGASFHQPDKLDTAMEIMGICDAHGCGFHVPVDVMCADSHDSDNPLDVPLEDVMGDMRIYDIGAHTIASFAEIIMHSKVLIWNGPMGMIEQKHFQKGTEMMAKAAAKTSAKTVLGGGDTLAALDMFNLPHDSYTHVSTGGGAMLELLEGKALPGLEILKI